MLHVYEQSRLSLRSLRPVLDRVQRHDRDLSRQMRRAGASVLLNIAEGARRMGRDCRQHFLIAAGSNAELRAALDVCDAFGYMAPGAYQELDKQLDATEPPLEPAEAGSSGTPISEMQGDARPSIQESNPSLKRHKPRRARRDHPPQRKHQNLRKRE